ncbi:MAG: amidohydrolase family protein [Myxococcota bacterium]
MALAREKWLEQTREQPLEPALRICDPHHHLWDRPQSRYMLEELAADAEGHNVRSTVFVECMSMYNADLPEALRPVGETEFVQGVAAQSASGQYGPMRAAAGIVSFADLSLGTAVDEVLEAHVRASPGRFRGIRHAAGWHASDEIRNSHTQPPQGLLAEPSFREGFGCLEKRGLSFDAWLYHPQLHELVDLARASEGTTIILDHVGGPLGIGPYAGKREQVFEAWKGPMEELSRCPNVVVKLGGLTMPICGFDFHKRDKPPGSAELAETLAPYYLFCIERFGPTRCMFESNFPVDRASCSYGVLWNAFKRISKGFASNERAALFHDTAVRVYRLEDGR